MFVRSTLTAALLFSAAPGVLAQTPGRADLRYTAASPYRVSYQSADTVDMTTSMAGMDMNMQVRMSTKVNASVAPAAEGMTVEVEVESLDGSVDSPMGVMPLPAGQMPPASTLRFTVRGPELDLEATAGAAASPDQLIGQSRMGSLPMVRLPGRELRIGETWQDTLRFDGEVEGQRIDVTMITRGTYRGDTTVAGALLNVLEVNGTMDMKMSGFAAGAGMQIDATVRNESRETVLWDSSRHVVVQRTLAGDMTMDSTTPNGPVKIGGRGRTVTRIVE